MLQRETFSCYEGVLYL